MKFPTPPQALHIRGVKDKLEKKLNSLLKIFGPYEKRIGDWYVTGGCIGSMLRDEEPNDFDIYFRTKEAMDHVVALLTQSPDLKQHIKDVEEKYRDVKGKDGKCITENAITMENGLQFITKHYGNEIRETFDFVHCMPMYSFENHRLYISEEQYDCCMNKILVVNEQDNFTHQRYDKFIKLGYTDGRNIIKQHVEVIEDNWLTELFGNKNGNK